jgi:hypothetical protein
MRWVLVTVPTQAAVRVGKRETAIVSGHIIAGHPITFTEVESKTGRYKDGRQTKNPISGIFLALLAAAKYRNN